MCPWFAFVVTNDTGHVRIHQIERVGPGWMVYFGETAYGSEKGAAALALLGYYGYFDWEREKDEEYMRYNNER